MPNFIYGIDFGTGDALAIHGPDGYGSVGPVSKKRLRLKPVKGGRTPAMEFPMMLEALFSGSGNYPAGDVVVESPTIGSSGCESKDIIDLLDRYPTRKLYTLSPHAVKNYRKDNGLGWDKGTRYARDGDPAPAPLDVDKQATVHVKEAEILYRIAIEMPYRLHRWTSPSTGPERIHTSVRPMDKHLYRDERSLSYLSTLPPFDTLPVELQNVIGNHTEPGTSDAYSRSMVMPFAMATEEPYIDDGLREDRRRRYEKLIGLYDRGYPSFYRKAVDVWLETLSKQMTGKRKRENITHEERKAAQKVMQRQIRWFFHLTMAHQGR